MTHVFQFSIAYIQFYLKKKEKIKGHANKFKFLARFIHIKITSQVA